MLDRAVDAYASERPDLARLQLTTTDDLERFGSVDSSLSPVSRVRLVPMLPVPCWSINGCPPGVTGDIDSYSQLNSGRVWAQV